MLYLVETFHQTNLTSKNVSDIKPYLAVLSTDTSMQAGLHNRMNNRDSAYKISQAMVSVTKCQPRSEEKKNDIFYYPKYIPP